MQLPDKRQTFWLLMAASAISMAISPRMAAPLRGTFDTVLAPISSWLYESSQSMRSTASQWATGGSASSAELARLNGDLLACRAELAVAQANNEVLTTQRDEATVVRGTLGFRGRLIPANVLSRDAVGWRESALLDIGKNSDLKPSQWAMAGVRSFVDRGRDSGQPGKLEDSSWAAAVVRGIQRQGVLIGRIEQVGQVASRIKLLTDFDSQLTAQIYPGPDAKAGDAGQPLAGAACIATCVIRGDGPNRLIASNVDPPKVQPHQGEAAERPVQPGDLVVTDPAAPSMPGALFIGVVESVDPVRHTAFIKPPDYSRLRRLYIFDPKEGP